MPCKPMRKEARPSCSRVLSREGRRPGVSFMANGRARPRLTVSRAIIRIARSRPMITVGAAVLGLTASYKTLGYSLALRSNNQRCENP